MSQSESLKPNGDEIRLGDMVIRTPGLEGTASLRGEGLDGMRSASLTTTELEQAFAREGMESVETIEIEDTNEVDVDVPGMRSTSYDEPAIELEVPGPPSGWEQVVFYTDESGTISWCLAEDEMGEAAPTRGSGVTRTYVLRRSVAPTPQRSGTRGLLGSLGRKVLQVLAFPIIERVGGRVVEWSLGRWERSQRPHRLRTFTPGDYREAEGGDEIIDWPWPTSKRALLMIHGTFSRTHIAFNRLPREFVEELHQRYEGRVASLDHLTLSEGPADNVRFLASRLPRDLELDIICHSRGGLVSRLMNEQADRFGLDSLAIKRVVFVAVPNNGTALADPRHLRSWVDSHTNLLNFFPDNGVTETLEAIINAVKSIAVGAARELRGAQAMDPAGDFLAELNRGSQGAANYFALGADFAPTERGFREFAKNILADSVFGEANDLIVPTSSVYAANPSEHFPVDDRHVYPRDQGIHHSGFFEHPDALERIRGWLFS